MLNTDNSLQEWVQNDLLPNIDWEHWLESRGLEPKRSGDHFVCKCPSCDERRCAFFPNQDSGEPRFLCNRKDSCGFKDHVLVVAGGTDSFPQGQDWKNTIKELAEFAGKPLPEEFESYTPAARAPALLDSYWSFLKSRFPGSKAEEYVRSRGLNPELHEFGVFPDRAEQVLAWAEDSGWSQKELTDAGLLKKKKSDGDLFPFAYGRLAGAFKDNRGQVFNIWGRDLSGSGSPKYLNLTNSAHAHKNAPYLVGERSGTVIWVEGYLDACAASECGYRAASSGTSTITDPMWANTRCDTAIIAMDDDGAGEKGTLSFLEKRLNDDSPSIWFTDPATMRGCKDIAELYQKHGADAVKEALATSNLRHRDAVLADLLVKQNCADASNISDFEAEQISLKAYELDKRLATSRCPSFEKHFWEPICDRTKYNYETILEAAHNNRAKEAQLKAKAKAEAACITAADAAMKLAETGDLEGARKAMQAGIANTDELLAEQHFLENIDTSTTLEMMHTHYQKTGSGLNLRIPFLRKNKHLVLPPGAITIIAAPTGHAKTLLQNDLALQILTRIDESRLLYLTLEESAEAIQAKMLNNFQADSIYDKRLCETNMEAIAEYFKGNHQFILKEKLAGFELAAKEFQEQFLETRRLITRYISSDIHDICNLVLSLKRKCPDLTAILIDYGQLLATPRTDLSRTEQLKNICDHLRQIAIETGVSVIVASQFNRQVTSEKEMYPTRLNESSDLEKVCSLLLMVWNRTKPPLGEKEIFTPKQELFFRIGKNRTGESEISGAIPFDPNTGRVMWDQQAHVLYGSIDEHASTLNTSSTRGVF